MNHYTMGVILQLQKKKEQPARHEFKKISPMHCHISDIEYWIVQVVMSYFVVSTLKGVLKDNIFSLAHFELSILNSISWIAFLLSQPWPRFPIPTHLSSEKHSLTDSDHLHHLVTTPLKKTPSAPLWCQSWCCMHGLISCPYLCLLWYHVFICFLGSHFLFILCFVYFVFWAIKPSTWVLHFVWLSYPSHLLRFRNVH